MSVKISMEIWFVLFVHSLSRVLLFVTPLTAAHQTSLSFTISQSLLQLTSIKLVMTSNHLVLCLPFLLLLQSFPALGSFLMSQLFTSGGQNFGASASVLLMNIQDWLHLRLTGLTSFQESFPTPQFESIHSLVLSLLYGPTLKDYVYFVGSPYPGLLIVSQYNILINEYKKFFYRIPGSLTTIMEV